MKSALKRRCYHEIKNFSIKSFYEGTQRSKIGQKAKRTNFTKKFFFCPWTHKNSEQGDQIGRIFDFLANFRLLCDFLRCVDFWKFQKQPKIVCNIVTTVQVMCQFWPKERIGPFFTNSSGHPDWESNFSRKKSSYRKWHHKPPKAHMCRRYHLLKQPWELLGQNVDWLNQLQKEFISPFYILL
jgi:hypothetical protein